MIYYQFILP